MEYLEAIPHGDNAEMFWAKILATALAKIHSVNMGKKPTWLAPLPQDDPLAKVYATEWQKQFRDLVQNNPKFKDEFGDLLPRIEESWVEFQNDVSEELATQSQLTLINPDFAPDHWLQKENDVAFIDWEICCFGPLYFDLPNMFDQNTVQYYYNALVEAGVKIPREVFVKKFKSLSRYLGFRFMVVGLDFWQNNLSDNLPDDYWQKHGEKFFYQCLDTAEHGYPTPKFD